MGCIMVRFPFSLSSDSLRYHEYLKQEKAFRDRVTSKAQKKAPQLLRVVPTTGAPEKDGDNEKESVEEEGEVKDKDDQTSLSDTKSNSGDEKGESLANLNEKGEEEESIDPASNDES